MYIREVRINGFTSYLSETSVNDFSPGVNVVVGRNGAGKSNFFAAMRFVLADLTDRTSSDLLYNGRGRRAAYSRVEVELADAASRFISLGDNVSIGREIVNGSDRYLVNGKHVTKSEARALLDAAGLSYGGNAFFIVPQGDVTRLASATDESRLSTLLAASGAQTFEDRKVAALKTLEESNNRLEECTGILNNMERHLQLVEHDAENLKEHLELRKQLRGIEHVLLTVESLRTNMVIASEDQKFEEQRERLDQATATFKECEKHLELNKSDMANIEAKLAEAEAELELSERESNSRRYEAKAAANLAAAVSTSTEYYGADESLTMNFNLTNRNTLSRNLSSAGSGMEVDGESMDSEEDFSNEPIDPEMIVDLKSELAKLRTELNNESKQLSASSARLRSLHLKEGRGNQLSSENMAKSRSDAVDRVEEAISGLHESLEQEKLRQKELSEAHENAVKELAEVETKSHEAAEEVAAVTADQQIAREELSEAESARAMALLAYRKAEITRERLEKSADQQTKLLLASNKSSTVRSVRGIRELAKQMNLSPSQYLGTIADLVDVQPTVGYAVDRIAGSQMFYHVVDNSETVRRLVEAMEKAPVGSMGSATFVPLADVIVDPARQFPEVEGTTPLSNMISVGDARFEKIVRLLFGKHVLCQDLRTAMNYARQHQLPSVTVEGDLCDPRGAISGGSPAGSATSEGATGRRNANFRQQYIRELGNLQESILRQYEEASLQRAAADAAAQRVTQCVDKLNKAKVQLLRASLARQDAGVPVMDMHEQVTTLSRKKEDAKAAIATLETRLSAAEEERNAVSSEASFAGALSQSERNEIDDLTAKVSKLQESVDNMNGQEYELATKCQRLQSRYEHQRAADIQRQADALAAEENGLSAAASEAEQKSMTAQAETIRRRRLLDEAQRALAQSQEKMRSAEDAARSAEQECKSISRRVENHSVKMRALSSLVNDLQNKLQQLGSIPEAALIQAQQFDSDNSSRPDERELKSIVKELNAKQKDLNKTLSKLGDVNQRAINDYETYAAELDSLRSQYHTLEGERETIEKTIQVLDSQKRQKLDAMLAKVMSKFENVFSALSGNEHGKLVLNRDNETGDLQSVGLDVSFGTRTTQMSGGQKSICALALIFAVQACDPAAFYIFDEIDANLDEGARKRVASTVKTISDRSGVQFICTSFREELVQTADAWFGVTYEGRESHIEPISKELATEFITVDVPNS